MATARYGTLLELLRTRAREQPESRGYTFLLDGEEEEAHLTYAGLDRQARRIAARLQALGAAGERALLLYAPGLDYVAAFFGCLYAGVTAVPAYPPDPERLGRTLPRLLAMAADAEASLVLTSAFIASMAESLFEQAPDLRAKRWLATDELPAGEEEAWRAPAVEPGTLAFLQYTSGSTGTPKAVCLSHQNLLHNLELIRRDFARAERPSAVIWLPPYHDMGLIGGILEPLYGGFPVALMSPLSFLQRPARWLRAITRFRGTVSGGPNFAFELCVRKVAPADRAGLDLSSWRTAFCGAEPIRQDTLDRFAEAFAPCGLRREALYPCYGLAESTLIVTGGPFGAPPRSRRFDPRGLEAGRAEPAAGDQGVPLVSCGEPMPELAVEVVRPASGERCPPGEIGEIWVAGPSVAQGYWRRPQETEETFRARLPGEARAFLRTGDLGFLQGGALFVAGRLKDLIIIRGLNHHPQDLERTVERAHPALRPGCGAAFPVTVNGEEALVVVHELDRAFLEDPGAPRWGEGAPAERARAAIAAQHGLEPHAVVLVKQGSIPKTSSGKIQRRACRAAYLEGTLELAAAPAPAPSPPPAAPRRTLGMSRVVGWLEERVASLAGVPAAELDPDRPITAYGLDSLRAVELQGGIEEELGVVLPLGAILRGPRLLELAREVLAAPPRAGRAPAPPAAPEEEAPLSDGQRALWFLQRLDPLGTAYHVVRAVRLRPAVDPGALRRALQALVDRHPALRATFPERDGAPVQRFLTGVAATLEEVDASGWSEEALARRLEEEAQRPFELARGPLFRAVLFSRPGGEEVLVLALHHLIIDLWSLAVLVRELGEAYAAERSGRRPELPPLPRSYPEWSRLQAESLAGPEGQAHWDYWLGALSGELPVLALPTDRPRPPVQTFQGAAFSFQIEERAARGLRELARARGATLFSTLLSGFSALLHRATGARDLILGTPLAGRLRAGFSGVIGYFVNPMPLRVDLSGDPTFLQLLERVQGAVRGALDHQELPFVRLVERLAPARDPSRSPIFQVDFALMQSQLRDGGVAALALDAPGARLEVGGLQAESLPIAQRSAQLDLSLMLAETGDGLGACFSYNSGLFDAATVERMAGQLNTLLGEIAARPGEPLSRLEWIPRPERERLLVEWNATRSPAPAPLLHQLLEEQAARTPGAVAVTCGGASLTYRELDGRANQLAHHLRARGIGPEALVGVHLDRSLEAVVAVFGALKAGGAFLLLDSAHPPARLAALLDDAGARVLVTHQAAEHDLSSAARPTVRLDPSFRALAQEPATPPAAAVAPENLAYVVYTSGSTGQPKGVMIPHAPIVNRLLWGRRAHPLGGEDSLLHSTAFSFDVSIWEIFSALLSGTGTRLVAAPASRHQDPAALVELIAREGITAVACVPSLLAVLLEEPGLERCARLRHAFLGGEALPDALRLRFFERFPEAMLLNLYGPSECAIDSTYFFCAPGPSDRPVPIGRPLGNVQAYVLDARLRPVPVGVPGELYLGGLGTGRGYLGRPDLTAERFLPHPWADPPGARLYRTGDLVRFRADGTLEFLGRRDQQVKIRGIRIELGEIESVLRAREDVREALVLPRAQDPAAALARAAQGDLLRELESVERLSEDEAGALLRP